MADRFPDYDPDQVFDESENDWTSTPSDLTTLGGGRYGKHIIAISGQAKIFFGET